MVGLPEDMILLNTWEAAKRFGVVQSTVRKWVYEGKLVPVRTPGGHLRFREVDVEGLLQLTRTVRGEK